MSPPGNLAIKDVQPTPLLVRSNNGLSQLADVTLKAPERVDRIVLTATAGKNRVENPVEGVPAGESTHRIRVPEVSKKTRLIVRAGSGTEAPSKNLDWHPPRRWTVYACQAAHFDPGYTGLPSTVMDEYLGFLDNVLDYCDETEDWPYESRFRYIVEQSWIADHYVRNRSAEQVGRFAAYCREGRIQVNALYGNVIQELMSSEELVRLLYPAFRLKRDLGIPITCAHHNDIPGISWGLVTALASAGIRYFSPGVPSYFSWGPTYRDCFDRSALRPKEVPAFWNWEGPGGETVLFHLSTFGASGPSDPTFDFLPGLLRKMEERGYAYDFFRLPMNGGYRDNAPPNFLLSVGAREWNAKYAFPRLIIATDEIFYEDCGMEFGKLPTHRGDFTATDYCVGATSTAQNLGISREAKGLLETAERFAAVASAVSGVPYPAETLAEAYDEMLRYDEHVWGNARPIGAGQDAALAEVAAYAHRSNSLAFTQAVRAVNAVADEISLDDGEHMVVFNPDGDSRTDIVSLPWRVDKPADMLMSPVEPEHKGDQVGPILRGTFAYGRDEFELDVKLLDGCFEIVDAESGERVPHQITKMDSALDPIQYAGQRVSYAMARPEFLYSLEFLATDVPAVGYRAYRIVRTKKPPKYSSTMKVSRKGLENEFFKVEVDPKSGAITSIHDKELGRELVDRRAKANLNQLLARDIRDAKVELAERSKVKGKRNGPCSVSLLVSGEAPGCPQRTQEIVLYAGIKRIDFHNRILKDATAERQIHYAFPLSVPKPRFRVDGPLAAVRPVQDQLPGTCTDYYAVQRWVAVSEGAGKWTALWSTRNAPLARLSKLWPDYVSQAHHNLKPKGFVHQWVKDQKEFKKGHIYSYVLTNNFGTNFNPCQAGDIVSSYSLTTHPGDYDPARARVFGAMSATPLYPVVMAGHRNRTGGLPGCRHSFVEIDSEAVRLLAVKEAEDGEGYIVRLQNETDRDARIALRLPFLGRISSACETNIVEEPTEGILVTDGEKVLVDIPAKGVTTVRIVPWRW